MGLGYVMSLGSLICGNGRCPGRVKQGDHGTWRLTRGSTLISIHAPLMLRTHVYLEQLQEGHVY